MTNKYFIEIFGWYGVLAILIAYTLDVFGVVTSQDPLFLWLNLTGSAGIIMVSWRKRNYQPMLLNVAWLLIAVIGLLQLLT